MRPMPTPRIHRTMASCVCILLLLALATTNVRAQVTDVGGIARDFAIPNHVTGQPLRLYDYSGSVIVLDFFAWWCGPCRASSPDVEENVLRYYRDRGGNPAGLPVTVISINIEAQSPEETEAYIASFGLELVADDFQQTAWKQFNTANAIPLFVVLNGAPDSTTHKQWQVMHRAAGYYGATHMRSLIDSVKAPQRIAPAITGQPQDLAVEANADATFTATATGSAPVALQWYKDDQPIPGAISASLTLHAVTAASAGAYHMTASNSVGVAASAKARLTVLDTNPVLFPSTELAAAVRTQLGLAADKPITAAALNNLTTLQAFSQQITSLTGLESAPRLTTLRLFNNKISDLTPLQGLTSLSVLDLSYNSVSNALPLAGLASLSDLDLSNNSLTNHAALRTLTSLKTLRLRSTGLAGLEPMKDLGALVTLDVSNNKITSLAPLTSLPSLQSLDISLNPVSVLAPVKDMPKLTSLTAGALPATDYSPLAASVSLRRLLITGALVTDFSWLSGMRNLTGLGLGSTSLDSLTPIVQCTNLESLDISRSRVTDLRPLQLFPKLSTLNVQGLWLEDVGAFTGLTQLATLDISQNRIRTLEGLQGLSKLNYLYASGNRVTDLAPISALPTFKALYINNNFLDLSSGSQAQGQLSALRAKGTYVNDASQGFQSSVVSVRRAADGCHVVFSGKTGKVHRILRATQPAGPWAVIATQTPGTNQFEYLDTAATGYKAAFYKLYVSQ